MKISMPTAVILCFALMAGTAAKLAESAQLNTAAEIERPWTNSTSRTQSVRVDGGSVLRDKYGFYWETRIEPPLPALSDGFSTSMVDSMGTIHRVLLDRSNRTYFGYDVLIDALSETNTYRVTFQPLVMSAAMVEGLSLNQWSEWRPLAAPRFPPPQTVHVGEILELTLLTNNRTNQRIADYVSIQDPAVRVPSWVPSFGSSSSSQDRAFSYATGSPRDFTSNDVEMSLKSPRVTINGVLEKSTEGRSDDVTGAFVWFYVPKHGRFILSLGAHPELGFQKAGEIRGTSLAFKIGQDSYVLNAGARIAPGQSAFNLYLVHQPNWKPTYTFADITAFNTGAGDQFESLDK
jgi:hypothetical protein